MEMYDLDMLDMGTYGMETSDINMLDLGGTCKT